MGTRGTCGPTRPRSRSGRNVIQVQALSRLAALCRQLFRSGLPRQIGVATGAERGFCLHYAGTGGATSVSGGNQVSGRGQHGDKEKSEQRSEHQGEQVPEPSAVASFVRELRDRK